MNTNWLLWESPDPSGKVNFNLVYKQTDFTIRDPPENIENESNTTLNTAMISPRSSKSSSPSPGSLKLKKVAKKKDPLRIKKPLNSFFLYRKKMREKIIFDHKVTAHQQISKIAASLWAAEPPDVKQQYQLESLEEFERHKKLHPDYLWPHRGSKTGDQGVKSNTLRSTTRRSGTPTGRLPRIETVPPKVIKPTPRRADGIVLQDPGHILSSDNMILIPLNENKSHYPCPHGSRRRAYCILCGGTFTCVHLKRKDQCKNCCKLPKGVCIHGSRQVDCKVCKYREVCKHYCDPAMCGDCHSTEKDSFRLAPIMVKVIFLVLIIG